MPPICSENGLGRRIMHFDEYEKKYQTWYAEFAGVVPHGDEQSARLATLTLNPSKSPAVSLVIY
jgi:hypothetical protein